MDLHPLAERFAAVAGEYERGRPEYPPEAIQELAAEFDLAPGAPVLDLAAGTGKLSRALLAGGMDVVAVEPQASLREILSTSIGSERTLEGTAEAIPLADASVRAVTVADAFHWFDAQRALAEITRVLKPGGGLAVLAAIPDWREASWAHELGTLLQSMRPEHPYFDGPPWREAVRAAGGWSEPREIQVSTEQSTDPERLVDYLASMSWVAALSDAERSQMLGRVKDLIESGHTPSRMPVHLMIGMSTLL